MHIHQNRKAYAMKGVKSLKQSRDLWALWSHHSLGSSWYITLIICRSWTVVDLFYCWARAICCKQRFKKIFSLYEGFLLFSIMLLICLLIIILRVELSSAVLEIPVDKNLSQEEMIKCAIEITNSNFEFRKETVVWFKDVELTLVDMFIKAYNGTVIVEDKGVRTRQAVVIVESFKSFMSILEELKPDLKGKSLLNGAAKFLIIFFNSRNIERLNSILWSYQVINVVIISKSGTNILLYTYFPYKTPMNCRNTATTLIGTWNETKINNYFPDKMQNMNQCPVYISTNKIKNPLTEKKIPLEIMKKEIVKLLRDIMNFTPIVSVNDFINIDSLRASNWSDSLSDVIAGVANISTCTIPLGVDQLGLLEYSIPYFRVQLLWLAPPKYPGPGWWRLLSPLKGYLWLFLLVITIFVKSLPFVVNIKPIKKFCRLYIKNAIKMQGTVFRIWGVMMGQPVHLAPKRFRDFYVIGLWIWFTFVVRSAYQSVLFGALKTDIIEGNYANLEETISAGYRVAGLSGIYSHFANEPMIKERFEVIPEANFDSLLQDVLEGKKRYVIATSMEYAYAFCVSLGKNGKDCGHVLPDAIMSVPLVIWMKEYSPFTRPLSIWLPRLIESGLLERDVGWKTAHCCPISSEPTPLTENQIISCMLCLFFGYVVSFAVFIVEIFGLKTVYSFNRKTPFVH